MEVDLLVSSNKNDQILHAPRTGQPVQVNSMYYWVPPDFFGRP